MDTCPENRIFSVESNDIYSAFSEEIIQEFGFRGDIMNLILSQWLLLEYSDSVLITYESVLN
ncbi:hypothetical protein GCM10011384_28890 [Psychrobacillus lasiicapitis]|nr:hypothetical protein GCM10011384_28890 [Psychrobacillus lasiicapitis]